MPFAANVVQAVDERHHWTGFEPLLRRRHRSWLRRSASERARLARAQADAHALRNAQLCGKPVALADAEREWSATLRAVRSAMLAIPSRVRQRLGNLRAADAAVIEDEVRWALTEAAGNGTS